MTANYFISKDYFDINDLYNIENTTKYKKHLIINKFDSQFYIVKYNKLYKKQLNSTAKLFRSVVFKHDKCVCFSPPKSISINDFRKNHKITDVKIEEMIDGTMINLFYDENLNWQICTKSTIGANCNYNLDSDITYREMFIEAMKKANLNLDYLDIRFCYSFILQHPKNRIVSLVISPQIYLIAVYEIINSNKGILIEELDIHNYYKNNNDFTNIIFKNHPLDYNNHNDINHNDVNKYTLNNSKFINKYQLINPNIFYGDYTYKDTYIKELLLATDHQLKIPRLFNMKNYRQLTRMYSSSNKFLPIYSNMGLALKSGNNRTKIINPRYNEVKLMKGNDRLIKTTYLRLRRQHLVKKYLRYFPEHNETFSNLNNKVKEITSRLYHLYYSCFVLRKIKFKQTDILLKHHLYNIHKQYIEKLRPENKIVDLRMVINYINSLKPYKLQQILDT